MAAVSQKEKDMIERRNREWDEAQRRKKARVAADKGSNTIRPAQPTLVSRGQARPATSPKRVSRYEELKTTIHTWLEDRFVVAAALKEIQDDELYKKEYSSFENFCHDEYGMTGSYAYRLIEAIEVKESIGSHQLVTQISNVSQALALSNVKESSRPAVLTRVVKSDKPVTAKSISEATKPRERKKKPKPVVIDIEPEPKPAIRNQITLDIVV